jgi:hypothetical protein
MWRALAIFFACCTAALSWLVYPQFLRPAPTIVSEDDLIFPMKTFFATKDFVGAKGTLTADWVGYKNNTYSILCLPTECIVASVEQIGAKQVSDIDGPISYPVIHWTQNDDVVAQDDNFCARITMTLDRRTETVLWVQTPINQTTMTCKNADNDIRKATLEPSLFWRKSQRTK